MIGFKKAALFSALLSVLSFMCMGHASAACSTLTFGCLHPDFIKTEIPAYWQFTSATSPVPYSKADNDYISQFVSPSGTQVQVVVKSPVTTKEYNVPVIGKNEAMETYFNNALMDAEGHLRNKTVIKFPKGTYNFAGEWPTGSQTCDQGYNWLLPSDGLTDVVIDGQGSTVNFSAICNGIGLWSVNRVVLKNFTFAWGGIKIASLGTITDVSQDADKNGPVKVHVDPIEFGPAPTMVASVSAWDSTNNHFDLVRPGDTSYYGDGVNTGMAIECAKMSEAGCTMTLQDQGGGFTKGQPVLVSYYNIGSAVVVYGQDVTFDHITLENFLGSGFGLFGGRGMRVTNSIITRMGNEPLSGAGNASAEFGPVSGDVVFDNNTFGYHGDDSFQLNFNIVQYEPNKVIPEDPNVQPSFMPFYAFKPSTPTKFVWPGQAVAGNIFVLYDNNLNYRGVRRVVAVDAVNANLNTLTLNQAVDADLIEKGFIGGDLSQFAGARYVVSNNVFQYNRGRALLLQTPFGMVNDNKFVGQTLRQVYLMTSLFWGEGGSAEEVTLVNNTFDARGHGGDFLALDLVAEPLNPFLNADNEVAGTQGDVAPPVNENVIFATNTFISDRVTDVVNISSAHNILFTGNRFQFTGAIPASDAGQYPISLHDVSDIAFDSTNTFNANWLSHASCTNSRLLNLASSSLPRPTVVADYPLACVITPTTSNFTFTTSHAN